MLELAIACGILTLLTFVGVWSFSLRPNALVAATNDFDAALASAQAVAATSGNGATLVFAPRVAPNGSALPGFMLRVYSGRPNGEATVAPARAIFVVGSAAVREKTLGGPPFTVFLDSAGNASGKAAYPQLDGRGDAEFASLAQEPPCPPGGFLLTFSVPQSHASQTRVLSCRSSTNDTAPSVTSPTPNVPLVTPTTLVFHWPSDAQQRLAATEWGYTHWFASGNGFSCGNGVAVFPNVLPSPFSAPAFANEGLAVPTPPPDTPFSYPNSGGESMNDAPAMFPLQPEAAGLCSTVLVDAFGQHATAAVAVMGWLTAAYDTQSATHAAGTITIPARALPSAGSNVTLALAKAYDGAPLSPRVAFTGTNAQVCAADLRAEASGGTTPATLSPAPATASVTLTVNVLPPSELACSGVVYNHYDDATAPSDAAAELGEGVPFAISLAPAGSPLSTLGAIVFWLAPGAGGVCSYAQLYLQDGSLDASAPNVTDAVNHTDAHGCTTNQTVNLWASEAHYAGDFSLDLGSCGSALRASASRWAVDDAITLQSAAAISECAMQVQSSDQTVSNGGAKSLHVIVNSCQGTTMTVGIGSGCLFMMPISSGDPPDCTPGGSGGEMVAVTVTSNPDPMLGTLATVNSDGTQDTYLWTRTQPGVQTISYDEVVTLCGRITKSQETYTFS